MYVSFDRDQLRAPYINIYKIGSGSSSSSSRPRQWWPCRPWRARRESARRALAAIQEKRNRRAPRGRSPRGRSKKNPEGFQRRGHESLAARRVTRCGGARVDLDHDGWGRSRRSGGDGWPSWSSSSSRQRARGVAALPVQFWERPSSRGVGDDHAPSDRLIVRRIMWLKPKRRGLAWSPCSIRSQQM